MAERSVNILIQARDEASAVFKKIASEAQSMRQRVNGAGGAGGGDGGGGDGKDWLKDSSSAIRQIGQVARVVGVARAGFDTLAGLVKTIGYATADWEGDLRSVRERAREIGETFERIPVFGLVTGPAYRAGNWIGELLFGDEREAKATEERMKQSESLLKQALAAEEKRQAGRSFTQRLQEEAERAFAIGTQRQRVEAEQAFNRQVEEIQKRRFSQSEQDTRQQLEAAASLRDSALRDVQKAEDDVAREGLQRWKKQQEDARKQREEARRRQMAEDQQYADEKAGAEAQIRAAKLRLDGRAVDAEIELTREKFRRLIQEARQAGKETLAEQLTQLQALEEQEARAGRQSSSGVRPSGRLPSARLRSAADLLPWMDLQRERTGLPGAAGGSTKDLQKDVKETNRLLRELPEQLRRAGVTLTTMSFGN